MMKLNLSRRQWLVLLLAFLPLVLLAFFYNRLPQQVPMQWNMENGVRYGDKSQLWVVGGVSVILGPMMILMPKIDPKRKNFERFQDHYDLFALGMDLFMTGMMALVISESLYPGRIPVSTVVCGGVGVLFLFMGNMLPKVKSNYTMGLRTPWALANEEVWTRTQRLGGKTMFLSGLLILIGTFFVTDVGLFWLLMITMFLGIGIPGVMSYVWYRQLSQEDDGNAR